MLKKLMWRNLYIGFLLSFLLAGNACGRSLNVAVASNFQQAAQAIAQEFTRIHGVNVALIPGASGALFAQIQQGAPYDVFLSADMAYAQALRDRELASDPQIYAVGQLVLWTPNPQSISRAHKLKTVVIAEPSLAPYGRAAKAVMAAQPQHNTRVVYAHNINHAYKLIDKGHADAGYIALSQLRFAQAQDPLKADEHAHEKTSQDRFILINKDLYPSLAQGATIVANSQQRKLAQKFLTFLLAPEQQAFLYRMGYAQQ